MRRATWAVLLLAMAGCGGRVEATKSAEDAYLEASTSHLGSMAEAVVTNGAIKEARLIPAAMGENYVALPLGAVVMVVDDPPDDGVGDREVLVMARSADIRTTLAVPGPDVHLKISRSCLKAK